MTVRLSGLILGLGLVLNANAQAAPVPGGESTFKPTVCVRIAPPDQILSDIRYTAELIARFAPSEKEAKEFVSGTDSALDKTLGPDWRKAIDAARPLLGYGTLDTNPTASTAVVLVAVKDRAAFEAMLKRLVGKVENAADGVLRFELPNSGTPATAGYARFANHYAYLTAFDPAVLAPNRIPAPVQIVAGDPTAAASIRVHLDRVPEQYRQKAVTSVQQFKAWMIGNFSGGGPMMYLSVMPTLLFGAPALQLYSLAEPAVRDGQELTVDLRYERKHLNLTFEALLTAKAGSELSRLTASLKPTTSLFPQMLAPDLAARGILRGTIPEDIRKVVVPHVEAGIAQVPQADPVWGAFAAKIGESLLPTLREGEIDLAGGLTGPTKERYGIIAGLRLADARGVEKAFRDAVKALPKDAQAMFKLDAATIAGVKVHQILPPALPEPAKSLFGDSTIHIAFRPDGVVVAFGEGAPASLSTGLATKPQPLPQTFLDVSGRKLVPLVTKIDADVGKKFKAFLGSDLDRLPIMEIAIEGGAALKVRYGNALVSFMPAAGLFMWRAVEMRQLQQARPVPAPPVPAAKPVDPR